MHRLDKILVANRGEIALRVMRACRDLDIKSVGVFSEADKGARHVKYADESYYIGPSDPLSSYLSIEKIIDIAISSGSSAIHPGYGFLSENHAFAEACEKEKIKFIGPNSKTLQKTGNKFEAKNVVAAQRIPVIPGSDAPCADFSEALDVAEKVGWPVLVKSVYGGGGRGIRTASNKKELELNFASAQREAKASFGRFGIYVEKRLVKPRHVEFQVLCDEQGNRIHLGERECSIQRRFQKLVEFSPSPVINETLRERIGSRAVKIAELFDYQNAGTVEFLFSDGEFYFIEVNSRLQVEHPVTESLTGIDIVKEQIRVANGENLRINQVAVSLHGAAIECRINAEDSTNDFAPSAGKITSFQQPAGPGIRVDTALYEGYEVTFFYDSLIAKLVAWATDMKEAMARTRTALSEFVIEGVKTTIPFHKVLIDDPEFLKLNISTSFIEKRHIVAKITENGLRGSSENEEVAALAAVIFRNIRRNIVPTRNSFMSGSKWRSYPVTNYTETPVGRFPDVL